MLFAPLYRVEFQSDNQKLKSWIMLTLFLNMLAHQPQKFDLNSVYRYLVKKGDTLNKIIKDTFNQHL